MRYIMVKFLCRLEANATFSTWKGSMLRGALGHGLRRALCVTRNDDCQSCLLGNNCIFRRLFTAPEGARAGNTPLLAPPFCLEPDTDTRQNYTAGENFHFNLKLFSFATDYLPYFAHAVITAGKRGLGRNNSPFTVLDILHGGKSIYDASIERMETPDAEDLPLPGLSQDASQIKTQIRIITPLRFKMANRLAPVLDFGVLANLCLRRARSLAALDGEDFRLDPDTLDAFRDLSGKSIPLASSWEWKDVGRYSSRQKAEMKFGGLTGSGLFQGAIGAFRQFLDFAAITHLGKQTSFGLGEIAWQGFGMAS